jgi:hypothetical protein
MIASVPAGFGGIFLRDLSDEFVRTERQARIPMLLETRSCLRAFRSFQHRTPSQQNVPVVI